LLMSFVTDSDVLTKGKGDYRMSPITVYFLDVGSSRKYIMIMNYAAALNDNLRSRPNLPRSAGARWREEVSRKKEW
jgi:hypothetical protein